MQNIELYLDRKYQVGEGTIGEFSTDAGLYCVTLENLPHYPKIAHKTRISSGRYPVRLRKVLTPMTSHYRDRFTWFTWHLEICDVPFFSDTYIHIGNKPDDTDGCPLVGEKALDGQAFITNSTDTYKELYCVLRDSLEKGDTVWINITDEEG